MSGKGRPFGLVLAGGRGTRMGRPKGDLDLGGRNLAERAADVLAPVCRSVLISVAAGSHNPVPGRVAIEDEPPAGRGPLAGIAQGFRSTRGADLLVLACDYPRVDRRLLQRLLDAAGAEHDIVMPVDTLGREHPLVALWSREMEAALRLALDDGRYAVLDLVRASRVRRMGPEQFEGLDLAAMLANVNTPEELDRL